MTTYEIISLFFASFAVAISVVSMVRTHKVQARQIEFEAITAALAKKQLDLIEKEEQTQEKACVTAELVKVGRTDYRFVIMNQGSAVASDVTFEIDHTSPDIPLAGNECKRKLPYPSLQPGQSFTLIAALNMYSAMSYKTHLKWKNPDGSQGANDIHLST
ncbi:MAG TPA: hypothetical protein VMW72_02360 [Sedimentisphaerales bacterium]|nr:hypothetical protein [Sedimentisphaerales bacterium]